MQAIRKQFVGDTLVYTGAQVLIRLRSLITLPLLSHALGAEGYGVFTQINITIALLVPFISFRLDTAIVRFLSGEPDRQRFRSRFYSGLIFLLLSSVLGGVLLAIFSDPFARLLFGDAAYAPYMSLSGLFLIASTLFAYITNYYRVVDQVKVLAVITFVQSLLAIALMLIPVYLGFGITGALWGLIIAYGVFSIAILIAIGNRIGWGGWSLQDLREMLSYGIPLMPNSLLQWWVNYADRLVITQVLGIAAIGVYSASYSIGQLLNLLTMPVGFVLFPFLSRFWDQGNVAETQRYFSYVTRYYLLLSLPAAAGLAFFSQDVLALLSTEEFQTSRILVLWITLGFLAFGLFQINVYAFHLVHKTTYVTATLAAGAVLNLVLNLALVPLIGLLGSAFATAATFFLMSAITIIYGRNVIGYQIQWLPIFKGILATSVMVLALSLLPLYGVWGILLGIIAGVFIYGSTLLVLQTFSKSELYQFLSWVSSAFSKRLAS